jgi:hypothetical protein
LLIESTFAYIKGEKPIEDIKLYPQKIQYTIESISKFHHSLNKSLILSVSEREAG